MGTAMVSSSVTGFALLPARPPTPPKELSTDIESAISFLDESTEIRQTSSALDNFELADVDQHPQPSSPLHDPVAIKKVGFSPFPTYHRSSRPLHLSPTAGLYSVSPSAKAPRPGKSILKQSTPLTPDDFEPGLGYFSPDVPGSFDKMLQSVLQHLAGSMRSSRLDGYSSLYGALRAYSNLPNRQTLISKMSQITQFLIRDMAARDDQGNFDVQIVVQTLQLTAVFLCDAALCDAMNDDFKIFLTDRCIAAMQQDNIPKQIMKMQMMLFAYQRFSSSIITSTKADRVISALQDIDTRCSGNNTIATRLMIYQRLVYQAPTVLLGRMSDWYVHVLHGMLSGHRDIRTRAIELGCHAGLSFGIQPAAARSITDIFETTSEGEHTYYDYFESRLMKMIHDKELGVCVSQIWSAVTLLFRSKRRSLDQWARFKSWLLILQRCLNSTDLAVRQEAYIAWSKLAFCLMPDATTSNSLLPLKIPISTGLARRSDDKQARHHKQCALDCFYMLLHYFMRPGLKQEDYDAAWAVFVSPLLSKSIIPHPDGAAIVSGIFHGFSRSGSGVWNANAAFGPGTIEPQDLPKLDPRWVRSRLSKILEVLQPLVLSSLNGTEETKTAMRSTWEHLMEIVAEARNQEVRASPDSKEAIASITNFLLHIWRSCIQPDYRNQTWLSEYILLVRGAMKALGHLNFTEDILTSTKDDSIQVAPTPSSRSSKSSAPARSPLNILFGLFDDRELATLPVFVVDASTLSLLRCALSGAPSTTSKLEILNKTLQINLQTDASAETRKPHTRTSLALITMTKSLLQADDLCSSSQDSQCLGQCLRGAVNILTALLPFTETTDDAALIGHMIDLFVAICNIAKSEAGAAAVASAAMEPLSKALLRLSSSLTSARMLTFICAILEHAAWPSGRSDKEEAEKSLWGFSTTSNSVKSFDPFEHVYELIVATATAAYRELDLTCSDNIAIISRLLNSITDFIISTPDIFALTMLRKCQNGLVVWIEDKSAKTSQIDAASLVSTLWNATVNKLSSQHGASNAFLKTFQPLLIAAFSSPHRSIFDTIVEFWNTQFPTNPGLEYPKPLLRVVQARMLEADLSLPESLDTNNGASIYFPGFYEIEPMTSIHVSAGQALGEVNSSSLLCDTETSPDDVTVKSKREDREINPGAPETGADLHPEVIVATPSSHARTDKAYLFALVHSSPTNEANVASSNRVQDIHPTTQILGSTLFPDFSSSPIAQSTALLPETLNKRLDFSTEEHGNIGTPQRIKEVTSLSSDDLPTSPTPSSNRGATPRLARIDEEIVFDDADPPSSPPQAPEDIDDVLQEFVESISESVEGNPSIPAVPTVCVSKQTETQPAASSTFVEASEWSATDAELTHDSALIAAQLQLEQAAADQAEGSSDNQKSWTQKFERGDGKRPRDTNCAKESEPQVPSSPAVREDKPDAQATAHSDGVLWVRDSFLEAGETTGPSSEPHSPRESKERGQRKRKRLAPVNQTARKRKQTSPLRRIFDYFRGSQEQNDEDEMEDEIVVAYSRSDRSPQSTQEDSSGSNVAENILENAKMAGPLRSISNQRSPQASGRRSLHGSPGTSAITKGDLQENEEDPITAEGKSSPIKPPSRGRGRPKTIKSPILERKRSADMLTRGSKRKASPDESENQHPSPRVEIIVPKRYRTRRQAASDALLPEPALLTLDELRRPEPNAPNELAPSTVAQGEPQALERPADAQRESTEATPQSIMARMQTALRDLKSVILGAEEQRAFCDVLFELQKETHEAAGRGAQEDVGN